MFIKPDLNPKNIQEFVLLWFKGFNQSSIPSTYFLN